MKCPPHQLPTDDSVHDLDSSEKSFKFPHKHWVCDWYTCLFWGLYLSDLHMKVAWILYEQYKDITFWLPVFWPSIFLDIVTCFKIKDYIQKRNTEDATVFIFSSCLSVVQISHQSFPPFRIHVSFSGCFKTPSDAVCNLNVLIYSYLFQWLENTGDNICNYNVGIHRKSRIPLNWIMWCDISDSLLREIYALNAASAWMCCDWRYE